MKKTLLIIFCALQCTGVFAQSEKDKRAYAEEAAKIQNEVWGNPVAEFKATAVPASLSKESAVILARSFSLSRISKAKFKVDIAFSVTPRTTKKSIFHERVKINDKSSLENFSKLEYQKRLDKTTSFLLARDIDLKNTYIGAKVIKPTGKEIIVNTSEEVLTSKEKNDQKGRLAISELQVGDVLDYYICKEDVSDQLDAITYKNNDNVIILVDEYPVLYYAIDFQFNKKIKARTIYANGASHFEESRNKDGDLLMSLKLKNVPKYQSQLWISGLRQYPYIEIGSAYADGIDRIIEKKHFEGETAMFLAQKQIFEDAFIEQNHDFSALEDLVKDHFKDKKSLRAASGDSVAKVLYTKWKFNTFCQYHPDDMKDFDGLNYRKAASKFNVLTICFILSDLKIDHDVLLVASRNSNTLNNVFNLDDFDAMIRINGDKPSYMCFDDVVTHFNEIPARYQGEKVIVLHPKRRNGHEYDFTEGEGVLPVSSNGQNYINEQLNVSLDVQDMKKLKIERHVREAGSLRHDDQKSLLLADEIDAAMIEAANGTQLDKRFKGYSDSKKFLTQVTDVFAKEHDGKDKGYTTEIKEKFSQEPQKVSNCKMISPAVNSVKPVFEYAASFELNNLVKKAGNNYIIDAGKLTGGFLKLDEKEKNRDKDIYMPSARSFNYTIVITIPAGYTVKGIDELTKKKTNKTGSFSSEGSVKGSVLTIKVTRAYNNNFEKAADWPLVKDLIDAASEFDSAKILLEKQG